MKGARCTAHGARCAVHVALCAVRRRSAQRGVCVVCARLLRFLEAIEVPGSCSTLPTAAPAKRTADIYKSVKFVELFAGSAGLTHAISSAGVPVVPPDDINLGGTDFRDPKQVDTLKALMRELAAAEGTSG